MTWPICDDDGFSGGNKYERKNSLQEFKLCLMVLLPVWGDFIGEPSVIALLRIESFGILVDFNQVMSIPVTIAYVARLLDKKNSPVVALNIHCAIF